MCFDPPSQPEQKPPPPPVAPPEDVEGNARQVAAKRKRRVNRSDFIIDPPDAGLSIPQ
jgi:hypothetical protein